MPTNTVSNEDNNKPTKKENSANSSSQTAPAAAENRQLVSTRSENRVSEIRNLEDLPFGRILVRAGRFVNGIFQRIYRMFNN